jgi:hypothetical protein
VDRQTELLALEQEFWTADAAFFREHVHERCLLVFPQMAELMTADEVADTVKDAPRWEHVDVTDPQFLMLADGTCLLSYLGRAQRGDDHYVARVSSVYLRRADQWKLAFHQHTPLSDG